MWKKNSKCDGHIFEGKCHVINGRKIGEGLREKEEKDMGIDISNMGSMTGNDMMKFEI